MEAQTNYPVSHGILVGLLLLLMLAWHSPSQAQDYRRSLGNGYECSVGASANTLHKLAQTRSLNFQSVRSKLVKLRDRISRQRNSRARVRSLNRTLRELTKCRRRTGNYAPLPTGPTPTPAQPGGSSLIADHAAVAAYDAIPQSVKDAIVQNNRIFYGHTSHGSQILTGLQIVAGVNSPPVLGIFHETGDDLGHSGDTAWVSPTRSWLNAHPETNVVMWSWCGGVSDNSQQGITTYLNAMSQLETEYPQVQFIYMTGHLDGSGDSGNLRVRNRQIRDYCRQNNKVLFDFEDIESWDPDGQYYPNESDACTWCSRWCSDNNCPSFRSLSCAHSHGFNCYQKGKAWWWLMARLAGWNL